MPNGMPGGNMGMNIFAGICWGPMGKTPGTSASSPWLNLQYAPRAQYPLSAQVNKCVHVGRATTHCNNPCIFPFSGPVDGTAPMARAHSCAGSCPHSHRPE